MSKIADLAEKLKQIKDDEQKKQIDWQNVKKDWLNEIDAVFNNIKIWLKPLSDKELIDISEVNRKIFEEKIGRYEVPSMIINFSNKTIKIIPIGTIIVGAKGRIDIFSPKMSAMVVKKQDSWKIALKKAHGYDYIDFNEGTFVDMIEEMLSS